MELGVRGSGLTDRGLSSLSRGTLILMAATLFFALKSAPTSVRIYVTRRESPDKKFLIARLLGILAAEGDVFSHAKSITISLSLGVMKKKKNEERNALGAE